MLAADEKITIAADGKRVFASTRAELQKADETSYRIQSLRDNADCRSGICTDRQQGCRLSVALTYDVNANIAAPFIGKGIRPKLAAVREQGVNRSCGNGGGAIAPVLKPLMCI